MTSKHLLQFIRNKLRTTPDVRLYFDSISSIFASPVRYVLWRCVLMHRVWHCLRSEPLVSPPLAPLLGRLRLARARLVCSDRRVNGCWLACV